MARIAFVAADRQLHVMDADGRNTRPVTFTKMPTPLSHWGASGGRDSCSWPVWSPDDRWLCCFVSPMGVDASSSCLISAVEVDGVEEQTLAALEGELPIYAQWNATGDRVAVLVQDQDELQLLTCKLGEIGRARVMEEGVPLFFSWQPTQSRLLVHVGQRPGQPGRVVLRDAAGPTEDVLYTDLPGSFCTPVFAGTDAVFALRDGSTSIVCAAGPDSEIRQLSRLPGLVAVVPSARRNELAVAHAPAGDSTPYQAISLVSLHDGSSRDVVNEPCLAYFFDPTGTRLVTCVPHGGGEMVWRLHDLETGERRTLSRFWPSPDQTYYLHFFEQYALSHPLVSPDGSTLVYSGYDAPDRGRGEPLVYAIDLLDTDATPRILGEGSFAVFSWS